MTARAFGTALLALALAACAHSAAPSPAHHPEARSYDAALDANAAVDAALERARVRGTRVLLVMGANWCHDSRALAGWLETPRFAALVDEHFELVFVNVGMPQTDDGHNLHIARRFGLDKLPGTPNLLVVGSDGSLLNRATATSWRNAASRDADAIYADLLGFTSI
ncbi:MAG: thioredoxin family protein [Erythrobacter sp.]